MVFHCPIFSLMFLIHVFLYAAVYCITLMHELEVILDISLKFLLRSPVWMFPVSGMKKQRAGSVIRDTRGKNVKSVSSENLSLNLFT